MCRAFLWIADKLLSGTPGGTDISEAFEKLGECSDLSMDFLELLSYFKELFLDANTNTIVAKAVERGNALLPEGVNPEIISYIGNGIIGILLAIAVCLALAKLQRITSRPKVLIHVKKVWIVVVSLTMGGYISIAGICVLNGGGETDPETYMVNLCFKRCAVTQIASDEISEIYVDVNENVKADGVIQICPENGESQKIECSSDNYLKGYAEYELEEGEYRITVKIEGYKEIEKAVIAGPEETELELQLIPENDKDTTKFSIVRKSNLMRIVNYSEELADSDDLVIIHGASGEATFDLEQFSDEDELFWADFNFLDVQVLNNENLYHVASYGDSDHMGNIEEEEEVTEFYSVLQLEVIQK